MANTVSTKSSESVQTESVRDRILNTARELFVNKI